MGEAMFSYGRAKYFQGLTAHIGCGAVDPRLFDDTNRRFEAARQRLSVAVGPTFDRVDRPAGPFRDGACDPGTLQSYAMHVGEFERAVAALPDPAGGR